MTHLDDGRLRAFMDDELSDSDAGAMRLHLEACDACVTRLAELEERSVLVAGALAHLDTAVPPPGARSAVIERIGSAPTRIRARRTPLARAAILVLFLGAGAATALPASPVRGWIAAGWARAAEIFGSPNNAATPFAPPEDATPTAGDGSGNVQERTLPGVRLDLADAEISMVLREIDSGTAIIVRFVSGGEAGAFASDPASFRTAEGRIEVIGAAGIVFVDLPQEATTASIEVNGATYLRKVGEQIDVTGPIEVRTTEQIHLRVP